MAVKSYVDLSGLGHFMDNLLVSQIIESGTGANITETKRAPSVKATYDYVQGEIEDALEIVDSQRIKSVSYDSTNKKIIYTNGSSHDVVTLSTILGDLDVFGPSGSGAKKGLVPSPGTTAGTTKFLREDGTWVVPTDTDTTYSAGTGLSLSGTTFNHSNSITAGTAGTSSATSGSTLEVPYVTYDAQGHITEKGTHTHTVTGFLTEHQSLSGYATETYVTTAINAAIGNAIAESY